VSSAQIFKVATGAATVSVGAVVGALVGALVGGVVGCSTTAVGSTDTVVGATVAWGAQLVIKMLSNSVNMMILRTGLDLFLITSSPLENDWLAGRSQGIPRKERCIPRHGLDILQIIVNVHIKIA
jgi:hypothetical protein